VWRRRDRIARDPPSSASSASAELSLAPDPAMEQPP
jgi:hypothetical protein